jgi:hypothetical protein
VNLDDATVGKYQEHRLTVDHAARNSVKYETGVLNAAFKVSQKRLGRAVAFKKGIKGVYCPARTHRR